MEFIKKNLWWLIAGVLVLLGIGAYNGAINKEESVAKAWADVEVQYQRRADLIPNLVNVVKGYAAHEKEVLESVSQARASAGSIQIDPSKLTPESIANFQKLQSGLTSALSRLLAVSERYPDLKANQNFLELQAQLEGTENRIAVSRGRFNDAVFDFNKHIRRFPNNLFNIAFQFEQKPTFQADAGTEKAPTVEF